MRLSDLDPDKRARHMRIESNVRKRVNGMQAPGTTSTATLLFARIAVVGAALAATIAGIALMRPRPAERPLVANIGVPTPAELLAMRSGAR